LLSSACYVALAAAATFVYGIVDKTAYVAVAGTTCKVGSKIWSTYESNTLALTCIFIQNLKLAACQIAVTGTDINVGEEVSCTD